MNVVITGTFGFPAGSASAARLRQLAHGLRENGATIHLVPMAFNVGSEISTVGGVHPFADGITYEQPAWFVKRLGLAPSGSGLLRQLRSRIGWILGLYGSIYPALVSIRRRILAGKCDLILVYGRSAVQMLAILRLAKAHQIPTVLDVVEVHESFAGFGGKANLLFWDWKVGTQVLPLRFSALTVINHELAVMYQELGCKRVLVLPSIEGWEELPAPVPQSKKHFRLVYVGALLQRDAPALLLDTMRILKVRGANVQLEIIGRYNCFPGGRSLANAIKADPALANVSLLGEMSDEQLAERLRAADGLILTRRNTRSEVYAFPTRLVEYLKTGRPVFVSNVGDIGMYLADGEQAILLPTDDAAAVAKRIQQVAESIDRGAAIGLAGNRQGARVFDRKANAAKLLEFMGVFQHAEVRPHATVLESR